MNWKIKVQEIKPGDMIKCINNPKRTMGPKEDNYGRGCGWALDKVYVVHEIQHNIVWPTNSHGGIYLDCVEKVC